MTDRAPTRHDLWRVKHHECVVCAAELSVDAFERYHRDGNAANHDPDNIDLVCGRCHDRVGSASPIRAQTEAVLEEIEAAMPEASRNAVIVEYLGRSRFDWTLDA